MSKNTTGKFHSLLIRLTLILLVSFTCQAAARVDQEASPDVRKQRLMAEQWGIELLSMRLTSAEYMLDFRYRVLDAEKAGMLFSRQVKPVLIDQASGARFVVPTPPKIGPLRATNPPKEGKNYFMLFANPGRFIKSGNLVTVEMGEFRAENIKVE